ncbi:hypothetical protein HBH1_04393 [Herbaspirillum sp. BH-1]|uniref:lysozyme inhibitor LprI family protein n=1 Tax=Herbaspirillum sp. (strain BH-1) TaxID=2058884 RepID=UPI000CB551CF|nr:lysozyme inhibitor LprI family protein [Herbaspirillum sp. BH-1]PLY57301.1 hypothetical protein HBH1_04393 [Herbaspirillum sp. BH-1]
MFVSAIFLNLSAYAATDSDIDKMTTYSVVLGRGVACGLDIKDAMEKVGKWVDIHFSPGSDDQKIYLPVFMEGVKYHAQQQKNGNSPDDCTKVRQIFAGFPWPNEMSPKDQNSKKNNLKESSVAKDEVAICREPKSQTDINLCSQNEYKAEEARINAVYNQYRDRLNSFEKQKIKEVQLAWIKFRDLSCGFEASATEGGSMQASLISQCMTEQTSVRRKQLEKMMQCSHRVVPGCE